MDILNRISCRVVFIIILIFIGNTLVISFSFASNSSWKEQKPLPYLLASHSSFSLVNKLFVINGSADFAKSRSEILSADIQNDGGLLNWQTSSNLPIALIWHAHTLKGSKLYILGGKEENPGSAENVINKVYFTNIRSDGSIPSWTQLNSLPKALAQGAAVVVGDRIFFAGGFGQENGFVMNDNIYSAVINSDGTIGAWMTAGTLPEPLAGFGMLANGNSITIIGGRNFATNHNSNQTYYTNVNADGTIAAWHQTSVLPEASYRAAITQIGSTVFSLGGANPDYSDNIYYATIKADGSLGTWQTSDQHLPQPICCGSVASDGNYLYMIGGYNGVANAYLDNVYSVQSSYIIGSLAVPYFSQNALPWGPLEYDHTSLLGINDATMDRWGCAVTSAAMVLRYHGMNQLLDGKSIDPQSLNTWLNDNHGYAYGVNKNGWYSSIIWPSITKLSSDLYQSGKSTVKLQYERKYPNATTSAMINHDLTVGNDVSKFPEILHVSFSQGGGHFFVAKGVLGSTYAINDPEWNYATLASFNSSYDQVDRYVPSHTDLSYIDVIVNPNVIILVTDPAGRRTGQTYINGQLKTFNEITNANYGFQRPIGNPNTNGVFESLGTGYNEFLLPTPVTGRYKITYSSNETTDYSANVISYQSNGTNTIQVMGGIMGKNQSETITLDYSRDSVSKTEKVVTFASVQADIKRLAELKLLSHRTYEPLHEMIEEAEESYRHGRKMTEQKLLRNFETLLKRLKKTAIKQQAFDILLYDIKYLQIHY